MGVIPKGARDILVKEVEEAGNFLALKRQDSEEYFLNGNYIIQWNGEYEAGGTTFYYERTGNMENLTAPGPTKEPVILQVLLLKKGINTSTSHCVVSRIKVKTVENER